MILVFDLDDTLYDESTYVDSGLGAVAELLSPLLGAPVAVLHARLRALLEERGRGRVFDLLLAEHGIDDPRLVADCVVAYHEHEPAIELSSGVRDMLEELSANPLYLVTDGDPDVQGRKIDALGLAGYFVECLRTWSFGPDAGKPSLFCFDLIRDREACDWPDITYVADDPSKDFVGLRAVGARTVRVHTGRFATVAAEPGFDAQDHVDAVTDVPALLGIASATGD